MRQIISKLGRALVAAIVGTVTLLAPASTEARTRFQELEQALAGLAEAPSATEVASACSTDRPGMVPEEESPLCQDLYRFSCAPGKWDDGTGAARDQAEVKDRMAEFRRQARASASARFAKVLRSPEGAYLKKIALSAFGMAAAPACAPDADPRPCDANLAASLARQAARSLFPRAPAGEEGAPGRPATSLRDLDLLLGNAIYRRTEERLGAEFRDRLRDPAAEKKVAKKIFPKVLKLLGDLIERKVGDPKVREILRTKVAGIVFDGTECRDPVPPDQTGESYDPSLSGLLVPNAFYNPAKNTFRYCNGFLLRSQSEFQIASVVAHELAHSIDPCLITTGPSDFTFRYSQPADRARSEGEYPLPGLLACLRQENSVGAQFLAPLSPDQLRLQANKKRARLKELDGVLAKDSTSPDEKERLNEERHRVRGQLSRLEARLAAAPGESDALDMGPPQPAFCRDDQIGESVADWVSDEILPTYLKQNFPKLTRSQRRTGYSNVFRGMCETDLMPEEQEEFDVHPAYDRRVNQLLLVQPQVRKQMGCRETPPADLATYCEVKDWRSR